MFKEKIVNRYIHLIKFASKLGKTYQHKIIDLIYKIVKATRVRLPLNYKKYIDKKQKIVLHEFNNKN